MSYTWHRADVSASSSSSARRPSTQDSYLKQEDLEKSAPQERKHQRTPTNAEDVESDNSSDRTGRTRKKAEPVKSACVQCQKRKTKCSGQRPVCRFCSDRNLECSWDIGDGLTRTADLKRKLQEANGRSDDLAKLVEAMRSGSDQTSSMLLARLRFGDSVDQLLSNIPLDVSPPADSGRFQLDPQMIEREENLHQQVMGVDFPSPTNADHQFDWPALGPQYQQMPTYQNWTNDTVPSPASYQQSYQQSNQQQPFFTTPDFDRSRMTWPRNDSFYPMEEDNGYEKSIQNFNHTQSMDAGAPPGVTMVPRNSVGALPLYTTATRSDHVAADT